MDWISNNTMRLTEKNLDFTWQRQRVIMDNIANVETPGYKAKYVTFENEFKRRLSDLPVGMERYRVVRDIADSSGYRINRDYDENMKLDENSVNIDTENVELARAQLQYDTLIRQINNQHSMMRTAIRGR